MAQPIRCSSLTLLVRIRMSKPITQGFTPVVRYPWTHEEFLQAEH